MTKRQKLQALNVADRTEEAGAIYHVETGSGDDYRSFGCAATRAAATKLRAAMRREPESYPALAEWIAA
jgi:hypothetical protein